MKLHALYRFFDNNGALLYVGITLNPGNRWAAHQDDKPWWTEVASITVQTYPDRRCVLNAERAAIQAEHPRYNIQHQTRQTPPADDPWTADDMPDQCHDYCRDGAIYLPWRWRQGIGRYQCRNGHRWTCGWGHEESGDAPQYRGVPIWTMP
jgi:predicted GIY-YIG superfamily endonuclease